MSGPEYETPIPADPDSENILLSTICQFQDHPEIPEILSLLNGGESFFVPRNRAIWHGFRAIFERGQEVSPISLKAECEAQGNLNTVGGFTGIFNLLDQGMEVAHPLILAKRTYDFWLRRQIQIKAGALVARAGNTMEDTQAILDSIRQLADSPTKADPLLSFPGMGDLLDTPAEPPQWVIPGLIPKAVPCVVASKGGLGKSFLFLQACIALATGKPFLDYAAQPPMAVLYLSLEDPRNTFKARLQSIIRWYQEADDWSAQDDALLRRNMEAPVIHWRAAHASSHLPDLVPFLENWIQAKMRDGALPGMAVIDTLARVAEGDENKVESLRPVLNACLRLCDLGFSTVLLHHVGKGQDGAKGSTKDRPALAERMNPEWVRGSSSIVDNFRAVIQLAAIREDEAESAGLDAEHARQGGFMVFGATKVNGQRADWRLLQMDECGRWYLPKGWAESLARIRGKRAIAALNKQTSILIDIHEATRWGGHPDMNLLAEKHFEDAKYTNKKNSLKQAISKLRAAGLLQKTDYLPTAQGLDLIKVTQRVHGNE